MGIPLMGRLAPRTATPRVDRGMGRVFFSSINMEGIKTLCEQELRELPLKIASVKAGRECISESVMAELGPLAFTIDDTGEVLRDWDFLASEVRAFIDLLDEISNGRAERFVREEKRPGPVGGYSYRVSYGGLPEGTVSSLDHRDCKEMVHGFVSMVVSDRLRKTEEMRMEPRWIDTSGGRSGEPLKFTPCLIVQGARACVWAGLTLLMTGNRIIKKCAYCGAPVDITDNHPNGKEWRTCGRCRLLVNNSVKRHRDKIRQALQRGETFDIGQLRFNRRKSGTNPAFVREKIIQLMVESGEATYEPERGVLHPIKR